MSEPKQVKVDNWGIYFLQRLKHFFNRTDYCDLTLQFQDNAQLKVHRLVLSACTEYFEVLERTCEMYEDCLVMPDDLQADVVVPIVNFMYTGQLEFKMDILERMHATSEIMNMPVLTKLLDSHRPKNKINYSYGPKRQFKQQNTIAQHSVEMVTTHTAAPKRSFQKAFEKSNIAFKDKKHFQPVKPAMTMNVTNGGVVYRAPSPILFGNVKTPKFVAGDPRPTRYELPEELDTDNIFENSFCNISYTSQPLMVHPETTKQYAKRPRQDKGQASTSRKSRSNILDIVECKKIEREPEECFYEESESAMVSDDSQMFKPAPAFHNINVKTESAKDPNKLFDQLLDHNEEHSAKVTIETTKNNKAGASLDHAKIISEVLKKYPHLVKSNKNIKLKIFNNPASSTKGVNKKQKPSPQQVVDGSQYIKADTISDYTFETDVLDSKQAARLIALGAENIEGPWICLICGTPGKALHFTSYYKFRRHLVEVHNEKPVQNICEYCGQRMSKRNHLLHHLYTKHGVEPPPSHHFPKCLQCDYIALTEALLIKHKLTHGIAQSKSFRCNVCPSSFNSSSLLLTHIQNTGHKYIADRKQSHQCIYCLRIFIRENNLYAHLKTHHKADAVKDGIIDESDDESKEDITKVVKHEPQTNEYEDNLMEYHIQQKPDGNIQLVKKKQTETQTPAVTPSKQKILNSGLTSEAPKAPSKSKATKTTTNIHQHQTEHNQDDQSTFNENEEIVVIDNNEYIMSGNRLILRKPTKQHSEEYILSDMIEHDKPEESSQSVAPSTSMDYASILNSKENIPRASIILKDTRNLSEPIPIYVSNEEEYKALMASNHNIIFDSNDANKTLTVLTTPDTATLDNTRINLDNTQNNDMMIIHEDYPMNVSEAVDTDNSNIVVVYSHQVSDPNKEYQLLTTQALGPQYVQTSAILTQNYEAVSTSSPIMSAHILDSPVATWRGDIDQNIDNQHTETSTVLQSIVHAEEVQTTYTPKSIKDINDLPQVQLMSEQTNLNETISTEPPESELVQNTQNVSMELHTSLDVPEKRIEYFTPLESVPVNEEGPQEVVNETAILAQSEPQKIGQGPTSEFLNMDVQNPYTNENISMDIQNSDTNENIISMDIQSSDTNIINPLTETVNVESTDTVNVESTGTVNLECTETVNVESAEPVCTADELCESEAVEQIQTITSEWSGDNIETPTQNTIEEEETEFENHTDHETKSEEKDESVESIQEEPKKQMHETNTPEYDADSLKKHDLPKTIKPIVPQVKISSLLNDWDDLDDFQENNEMNECASTEPIKETEPSHTENPEADNVIPAKEQDIVKDISSESAENYSENPPTSPDDEVIENTPTDPEINETLPENEIIAKQDNIKSLVSDWDDDEEDNNKE